MDCLMQKTAAHQKVLQTLRILAMDAFHWHIKIIIFYNTSNPGLRIYPGRLINGAIAYSSELLLWFGSHVKPVGTVSINRISSL